MIKRGLVAVSRHDKSNVPIHHSVSLAGRIATDYITLPLVSATTRQFIFLFTQLVTFSHKCSLDPTSKCLLPLSSPLPQTPHFHMAKTPNMQHPRPTFAEQRYMKRRKGKTSTVPPPLPYASQITIVAIGQPNLLPAGPVRAPVASAAVATQPRALPRQRPWLPPT